MPYRCAFGRPPVVAATAMVATSQTLATRAGLRALERGGNAVDAALAAAAVLCVAEPMSTGVGGDAFALVWHDGDLYALDAAGPAPHDADPLEPVEEKGPRSVTVPGAVAGWTALAERFSRLGLDSALADAIDAAESGVAVGVITAADWARSKAPPEIGPPPRPGERFRLPELGRTLRRIAADGPLAFYGGEVGEAIVSATWLSEEDLANYEPAWVEPLSVGYRGASVVEMPAPTQGVAVLEALGMLGLENQPDLLMQIECVRLALEDAYIHVRDGASLGRLLDPLYLNRRRHETSLPAREPRGGTVYLCVVDGDGMAVSFIQSLFDGFGSGVVAPGTGVVLHNRGACFSVSGRVEAGRRPYHTLIPGMLVKGDGLLGPFGVMGGYVQAQAHVQVISALLDDGLDPQAALDRPRFRFEGGSVLLEEGLWEAGAGLEDAGMLVVRSSDPFQFGGGQVILTSGGSLIGGSDPRKDGCAAGF